MQIHVYDHAQQVGQAAATLLAAQLISKPNSVLGLATGSTPIPTVSGADPACARAA